MLKCASRTRPDQETGIRNHKSALQPMSRMHDGGALLIRGLLCAPHRLGSRLCGAPYWTMLRIATRTLHRVRDTQGIASRSLWTRFQGVETKQPHAEGEHLRASRSMGGTTQPRGESHAP